MNLKESICEILSDKKAKRVGLHVKHIARHIHNINNNLFSDLSEIDFDNLKRKVNRILANDVKKKKYVCESDKPKDRKIQKRVLQVKTFPYSCIETSKVNTANNVTLT